MLTKNNKSDHCAIVPHNVTAFFRNDDNYDDTDDKDKEGCWWR